MARLVEQLQLELGGGEALTLADLLARWLAEYVEPGPWSAGRKRLCRRCAARVGALCGSTLADQVGPAEVGVVERELARLPAERTHTLATLRQALRWGRTEGLVSGPDRLRWMRLPLPAKRERVLTREEWTRAWRALATMPARHGSRAPMDLLRLAMLTGARPGELAQLTWGAVSMHCRSLTVLAETEKRRRARVVPLDEPALALLREQPTREGLVFPSPRSGRPIESSTWWHTWRRALELAGVEKCPVYTIRHTTCTRMLERGFRASVVSELVGNSPRVLLERYDHAQRAQVRAAAQSLSGDIDLDDS